MTLQVLDYDEKRLHVYLELFHETDGFLAATWEQMSLHIDMIAKRASIFPDDVLEKIEKMYQAHKDIAQGPANGHKMQIKKKK